MIINTQKNRERDPYSFANINLLGRCNVNCFFCLGKDIESELKPFNHLHTHYRDWENFPIFLDKCKENGIGKLYITGQNTDSLQYEFLPQLVAYLHRHHFKVGLRTNGYLAEEKMKTINYCELSTGYSIHSLDPVTNQMIMRRSDLPNWGKIIPATKRCRVSIVINRCNKHEFFPLLRYISGFHNVRYIQVRRVSTDTRIESLTPDMVAYEEIYTKVREVFPVKKHFWGDVDAFDIYGKEVNFWRTTKTTVNSMNYFTDGTISDMYFIVEGYKKYASRSLPVVT